MTDRDHKPRGFGFITFEDIKAIDRVLEHNEHYLNGKFVECKKAVPKEISKKHSSNKIEIESIESSISAF